MKTKQYILLNDTYTRKQVKRIISGIIDDCSSGEYNEFKF